MTLPPNKNPRHLSDKLGLQLDGLRLRQSFRAHSNDRDFVRFDRLQVRLRELKGHACDQEGPDVVAETVSVEMALRWD